MVQNSVKVLESVWRGGEGDGDNVLDTHEISQSLYAPLVPSYPYSSVHELLA